MAGKDMEVFDARSSACCKQMPPQTMRAQKRENDTRAYFHLSSFRHLIFSA